MKGYFPKDKQIENILKRLSRDGATFTSPETAKKLSRHRKIRTLRQQNKFYIGRDYRKRKSILFYDGKIRIDENGIHFD